MAETRAAVPVARARGACTGADPREAAAMTEQGGRETRPWVVVDGSSVASSEYDDL